MPLLRASFDEPAYPGEYTPKRQILKALSEGLFDDQRSSTEPKVTISESVENYRVEFTVPGLQRENLLVTINEKGNLCILSMNKKKKSFADKHFVKSSSSIETFLKEIPLPEYVDPGFVSATCHAGTLSIFFTKSDHPVKKRPSTIVVY